MNRLQLGALSEDRRIHLGDRVGKNNGFKLKLTLEYAVSELKFKPRNKKEKDNDNKGDKGGRKGKNKDNKGKKSNEEIKEEQELEELERLEQNDGRSKLDDD